MILSVATCGTRWRPYRPNDRRAAALFPNRSRSSRAQPVVRSQGAPLHASIVCAASAPTPSGMIVADGMVITVVSRTKPAKPPGGWPIKSRRKAIGPDFARMVATSPKSSSRRNRSGRLTLRWPVRAFLIPPCGRRHPCGFGSRLSPCSQFSRLADARRVRKEPKASRGRPAHRAREGSKGRRDHKARRVIRAFPDRRVRKARRASRVLQDRRGLKGPRATRALRDPLDRPLRAPSPS